MITALLALAAVARPLTPAEELEILHAQVRSQFTSLQWGRFASKEWIYLAEFYGLRAIFVLVLMTMAWTMSSWASSVVRRASAA